MKLQTEIKPRRDGTVLATGPSGARYVFKPDEHGDLVCDVSDEADLAHFVGNEFFFPALLTDQAAAMEIVKRSQDPDGEDDGEPEDDEDEDGDDFPVGALPVEAETPVKVRRKPGPKPKAK